MRFRYAKSLLVGLGVIVGLALAGLAFAATNTTWNFDVPGDYSYPETVEVTGGVAQLAAGAVAPSWWDLNWGYRQQLVISHGLSIDLPAGTPVRLRLGHAALYAAGRAKVGGEDVRILYRDPSTGDWQELDRTVEAGANGWNVASPALTDVWFKTQSTIPVSTSSMDYWVYYGNPDATNPPENRAVVFDSNSLQWSTDARWALGTVGANTKSVDNSLQLAPGAVTTRLPNAADSEVWYYTSGGGGYTSAGNSPPDAGLAGWVRMSDATKLGNMTTTGGGFYELKVTSARNQWDWAKFKFHLPTSNILTLNAKWMGWGDPATNYYEYLYILNPSGSWEQMKSNQYHSSPGGTLQIDLTDATSARNYISPSGDVWIAVGAKHSNYAPNKPVLVSPAHGSYYDDYTSTTLTFNKFAAPDTVPDLDLNDPVTYTLYFSGDGYVPHTPSFNGNQGTFSVNFPRDFDADYYWYVEVTDGSVTTRSDTWWFHNTDASCPFLLVWNGAEYQYVTDVAGQPLEAPFLVGKAPLPGQLRLPFYVPHLIPMPQLAPDQNNQYRMKLREGQKEIDYADEVKLWLVDVPEGYEVRSTTAEDRTKIPAKNPVKLYTLKDPHQLIKAQTLDGEDVTPLLRERDGKAAPASASTGYILDFGQLAHPEYAKLLIDGWKWTRWQYDAVDNNLPRQLITIDVPGKDGQWVEVKRVGPPNAAPDWMIIDLGNVWPTDDHRIRLRNFVYSRLTTVMDWVALDDSAPVEPKITKVQPIEAELSHPGRNGYAKPTADHAYLVRDDVKSDLPDVWAAGAFTRLGDVRPLLSAQDNKYVIMQSGDAIELVFPNAAPPAPGYRRIPVFYGDIFYRGDAKTVEPLPFHGMGDYPYKAPEKYPDDADHQQYQAEWNTRVYDAPPAPTLPSAQDDSVHSLNTDYAAVSYGVYPTSAVYYTDQTTLTNPDDQIAVVYADYDVVTPAGTTVQVEVSVDGTNYVPIADLETKAFAPSGSNNKLRFRVTLTTADQTVTPQVRSLSAIYYVRRLFTPEPTVSSISTVEAPFSSTKPPLTPVGSVKYTSLSSFAATLGTGTTGTVRFQVSKDNGSNWYYWTGSAWATATVSVAQTCTAAEVNAHLTEFLAQVPIDLGTGYGQFKWRAFLISDGTQQVKLDEVTLDSTLADTVTVTPVTLAPSSVQQNASNPVLMGKFTLSTDHGTAKWTSLTANLGAGEYATDVDAVKVWKDANGNGAFDLGTDTAIGTGTLTTVDGQGVGTIDIVDQTIMPTPQAYFVSYDFSETATPGHTAGLTVDSSSFNILVDADNSGDTVASTNLPFNSVHPSILDDPDVVTMTFDGTTNVQDAVALGAQNVLVGKVRLTTDADQATLSRLTVRFVGTAADSDIVQVRLWRDVNDDGVLSGDTLVGQTSALGGLAQLSVTGNGTATSTGQNFLVTVDVAPGATTGNTIRMELASTGDVQLAVATPSDIMSPSNFPVLGKSIAIQAVDGFLDITGANLAPSGTTAKQGTLNVPIGKLVLKASVGTVTLNRFVLVPTVASDDDIANVKVWRDNGSDTFDAGDSLLVAWDYTQGLTIVMPAESIGTTSQTYWITTDIGSVNNVSDQVSFYIPDASSFALEGTNVPRFTGGVTSLTFGPLQITDEGDTVTVTPASGEPTAQQGEQRVIVAKVTASTPDSATLTSLTLDQVGTAGDSEVTGIELWRDVNDNGTLETTTDQRVAGPLTLISSRAAFSVLSEAVGSTSTTYLVTANIADNATVGANLQFRIPNNTYVTVLGPDDSVGSILSFTTAPTEITDDPDIVTVAAAELTPVAAQGATGVQMERFTLATDADSATITSVRVDLATGTTPAETITDGDIAAVKILRGDGSGTELASGAFTGGTATLVLSPALTATSTPTSILVVYDFAAGAPAGGKAGVRIANASYFSAGDDTVSSVGFPFQSNLATLNDSPDTVTAAFTDLAPSRVLAGQTTISVAAVHVATDSDAATLQSITVGTSGTGAGTGIARVRLFKDVNNNQTFDLGTDTALVESSLTGGNATLTVPAGADRAITTTGQDYLVLLDLSDSAVAGQQYRLMINGSAAFSVPAPDIASATIPVFESQGMTVGRPSDGIPVTDGKITIDSSVDTTPGTVTVDVPITGTSAAPSVTVRVESVDANGDPSGTAPQNLTVTVGGDGAWHADIAWNPGRNIVTVIDPLAGERTFEVDLIDPSGIVYNTVTGQPLAGATVTVFDEENNVYATQTTGADGEYSFLTPPGRFRLGVVVTGYLDVPTGSELVAVPAGDGLGGVDASVDGTYTDIYYGAWFQVVSAPLHFDVPMDPENFDGFAVTKSVNKTQVSVGETLTYRVEVRNPAELAFMNVIVEDTPPAGFKFLSGSARLNGAVLADPTSAGGHLRFTIPLLAASGRSTVTYVMSVTPSVKLGVKTNSATVTRAGSAVRFSGTATASVEVVLDALFQTSTISGKVFTDTNGNGAQDNGEEGVNGARILVHDGSVVTTDEYGRYHISGFRAGTAGLKVDPASVGNREFTTANPVAVTLLAGSPAIVNFGVAPGAGEASAAKKEPFFVAGEMTVNRDGVQGGMGAYIEKTIGQYRIKASIDSRRTADETSRETTADPFAVYGDASQVDLSATETRGPVFAQVDWKGGSGRWGNFKVPTVAGATGGEVYGGSVKLHGQPGSDGKPDRQAEIYAGTRANPRARNEIRATDGSLYYLKHGHIVAGTARVWLEARDADTGRVLARVDRTVGVDYDLNTVQGRLLFNEPVPSAVSGGALAGVSAIDDSPVYILVDYEYDSDFEAPSVAGGRVEVQVAPGVRGGITVQRTLEGTASTIAAVDVQAKVGKTEVKAKAGIGQSSDLAKYTSADGGLQYTEAAVPDSKGTEVDVAAKSDLSELAGKAIKSAADLKAEIAKLGENINKFGEPKPSELDKKIAADIEAFKKDGAMPEAKLKGLSTNDMILKSDNHLSDAPKVEDRKDECLAIAEPGGLVVEGEYKKTEDGYSDGADPAATNSESTTYTVTAKATDDATVTLKSDVNVTDASTERKTSVGIKMTEDRATLSAEYALHDTEIADDTTTDSGYVVKYEYKVTNAATVMVSRKLSDQDESLDTTGYGVELKLPRRTTTSLTHETGDATDKTQLRLSTGIGEQGSVYTNYTVEDTIATGETSTLTFGGSTDVNDKTRLFVERRLETMTDSANGNNVVGAQFKPNDKLDLSVAFTQTDGGDADKSGGSVSVAYREPAKGLKLSTALEAGSNSSVEDQVSGVGRVEWQANPSLSLVGKVSAAKTETEVTGELPDSVEVGLGVAYRPVSNSRVSALGQFVQRREIRHNLGGDDDETLANVVAAEVGYELVPRVQLVQKAAFKRAKESAGGSLLGDTDTLLLATRVNYHVTKLADFGLEYRFIDSEAGQDDGFLVEADVAVPSAPNLRIGAGYNFTSFSDNLLDEEDAGGWFLRLRGLF